MRTRGKHSTSLRRALGVVAVVAIVATACDPGKVTPTAGTGASGNTGDGGPATAATFEKPTGIVAIPGGGYYVTDTTACVIRKVDAAGTITTIAGTGTCGNTGDGGPAASAEIRPTTIAQGGQLALDAAGNLYFASRTGSLASTNAAIRKIDTSGTVTSIADSGASTCGVLNGTILPTYYQPADLTVTPDGSVYVACRYELNRIAPDGTNDVVYQGRVLGVASDASGTVYVSAVNTDGHKVVGTLNGDGTLTTLVDLTSVTGDPYVRITHLTVDGSGNVYGAAGPSDTLLGGSYYTTTLAPLPSVNAVYRLGPGTATKVAGTGQPDPDTGIQTGHGYQLSVSPTGITIDAGGNLLVTSGHVVYRIAAAAHAALWDGTACNPSTIHAGADLSGADLHDQNLHGCDFTGVDLTGANLTGADLTAATFINTTLAGADLTGADLTGATSRAVVGTPSALPSGWTVAHGLLLGAGANFHLADFSGADLTGLDLAGLDLTDADLTGADLSGADLSGTDLSAAQISANFTGADLTAADLTYTHGSPDFTNADLTNVVTHSGYPYLKDDPGSTGSFPAEYTNADLSGATLTGANLSYVSSASCTGLHSGGIVGTPTALPAGWTLLDGYLICSGADLTDADLSGQDLSGRNLTDVDLTGADLTGANLTSASLQRANLDGTALAGANLTSAGLQGANLGGAALAGATMTNVVVCTIAFAGAPVSLPTGWSSPTTTTARYLLGPTVNARGCDLSGLDLPAVDLTGADLTYANLSGASMGTTTLTGATACSLAGGPPASLPTGWTFAASCLIGPGATLNGANLSNLDLTGTNFTGASLTNANLSNSNLTGANLSDLNLSGVIFIGANLTDANLSSSDLDVATLTGATVAGATFTGASATVLYVSGLHGTPASAPTGLVFRTDDTATHGVFVGPSANLTGTDLTGVDLSGLDLTAANLDNTNLTGADLSSSDLDGATLTRATVAGATFTSATSAGLHANSLHGTPTSAPTGLVFRTDTTATHGVFAGPGANLTGVDLSGASLTGVTSGGVTGTPTALPAGWQLTGGYLVGPGASLSRADLGGADLSHADLSGADLSTASLSGAVLTYANLTNANLTGASLSMASANHATITGADFTNARFVRLRAGAVVGTPATLPANWALREGFLVGPNGNLTGFNMTGVDLSNLDLTGASLNYSNLTNTNLAGTNLTNADLSSANFTGATGTPTGGSFATYSNTTCPDASVATSPATCVGHGFAS